MHQPYPRDLAQDRDRGNQPGQAYDDAAGFMFCFKGQNSKLVNITGNEYRAAIDRTFLKFEFFLN